MTKYNQRTIQGIYKRVVGTMSGLADINVEIHPQVVPHYEPATKTIRMPSSVSYAKDSNEEFVYGRGICVHEASHVLFAPPITGSLRRIEDNDFWEWFNVFADANNEYKVSKVFPNLGKPLADKTEALFKAKPEMLEHDNPFLQTLIRIDKLIDVKPKFPVGYSKDLEKFVNKVVKKWEDGKIYSCKGKKLITFTKGVFEDWRKLKKKHQNYKNPNQAKIKELMELMGKKIKSGGSKEEVNNIEKEISGLSKAKEPWFDDKAQTPMVREVNTDEVNVSEKELSEIVKEIKKIAEEELEMKKSAGGLGTNSIETISIKPIGDIKDISDINTLYRRGKRINRMLKRRIKLQEDLERRHRNGHSIDMNEIRDQISKAGKLTNAQVFQRDNTFTQGGEWAVEVLIDCSGSMGEFKMDSAKRALATLAYAIDGLPNVKWALTGFDSDGKCVREFQIKKFNDPRFKLDLLKRTTACGGTPTSKVVRNSAVRLLRYKGLRKLMVVITDGQPYDPVLTSKIIKKVSKKIKVLGIGIEGIDESHMADLFPTYYMFNESASLETDLTNLILQALEQKDRVMFRKSWEV